MPARAKSGPLWVTAGRQTAGRGRRGRRFISEPGNLYASLLLTNACPSPEPPSHCFVAGLAVHDALACTAHELLGRLALKWPNDVLCDGRKLAGILVEGEASIGGHLATAIGIGVNCAHITAGLPYRATILPPPGASCRPHSSFRELSKAMRDRLQERDQGRGFAATRQTWLARTVGVGQPIRVDLGDRQLQGRFAGLDEGGRLQLAVTDGGGLRPNGRGRVSNSPPYDYPSGPRASGRRPNPKDDRRRTSANSIRAIGRGRRDSRDESGPPPVRARAHQGLVGRGAYGWRSAGRLPGIDLVMPDVRFLTEERRNLLAIVLTHAHEDHFGALLLYLWLQLAGADLCDPVYGSPPPS